MDNFKNNWQNIFRRKMSDCPPGPRFFLPVRFLPNASIEYWIFPLAPLALLFFRVKLWMNCDKEVRFVN